MSSGKTASSGSKNYPMPFTRIEVVVLSVVEGALQVLLARRAEAPYAGKWALPGGVLRIDLDGSLEAAARRVMAERLDAEIPFMEQLCAVGGPRRDPRADWAMSIVFKALVPLDRVHVHAGKRIESLAWRPADQVMEDAHLAFDHAELIRNAVEATRRRIELMAMPAGLLGEQFTLGDLQMVCEQVLGKKLDKSSFRRKLASRNIVEPVEGETRGGAFRPAQLYRLVGE